jgi:hypothetical protein
MRNTLVLLLMFLFIFSPAMAQEEPQPQQAQEIKPLLNPGGCKKLCDNFITLLNSQKYADAFNVLKPYWPLPENEISALQMQTV